MKCPEVRLSRLRARRSLPQLRLRFLLERSSAGARTSRSAATRETDAAARRSVADRRGQPMASRAGRCRTAPISIASSATLIPAAPAEARAPSAAPSLTDAAPELPLFGPPIPDDEPLITQASPPRPPLACAAPRRTCRRLRTETPLRTPTSISRSRRRRPPIVLPARPADGAAGRHVAGATRSHGRRRRRAPARRAASILLILAAIDVVVIYFTMQILRPHDRRPRHPAEGPARSRSCCVQNGGYLVAFTAGGQTLGKMAAGIRVVSPMPTGSLDLGRAFLRTLMWVVLAVPAGLGFLTALFSRDHRGLHDRFAGTRVVRASGVSRPRGARAAPSRRSAGVGYAPVAPGTFGPPPACVSGGCCRRRRVQAAAIVALFVGRIVERRRRRAAFRPHRSRPGRHRRSDGHAHHAVPQSRRLGRRVRRLSSCSASFDVIKPYPANRLERLHGGVGVMADDAMAAVYANLALRRALWHWYMLVG